MKKNNRVASNEDFVTAIRKGQHQRGNSFLIHYFNNECGYTRIGISVSSKLGNAVIRNRVKRQIRAMCDSLISYNNSSYDVIIIAKNNFLISSYQTNKMELGELLRKSELIK